MHNDYSEIEKSCENCVCSDIRHGCGRCDGGIPSNLVTYKDFDNFEAKPELLNISSTPSESLNKSAFNTGYDVGFAAGREEGRLEVLREELKRLERKVGDKHVS